jgi:hypothetical protein
MVPQIQVSQEDFAHISVECLWISKWVCGSKWKSGSYLDFLERLGIFRASIRSRRSVATRACGSKEGILSYSFRGHKWPLFHQNAGRQSQNNPSTPGASPGVSFFAVRRRRGTGTRKGSARRVGTAQAFFWLCRHYGDGMTEEAVT